MTEQYRVEKIIDKRITNGKNYYKIKWLHYPEDQCTWEPERHLSTCKDLIKKFNDNLSKLQQTKQNETTAKSLDYNPQKTATNTKSGTQKGKVKQSTKRIRRQEEQSESERIFQEEQKSQSSDGKFKRPLPSKLKKGPPARKTANNHSFRIQNDQESQHEDDLIQEKPKLSPQIIPQAKTSKLSEGAKVEVLGMVQIDKQKYFRISQNGTIREISREQLISQDPIALVHFYQRNIRFLPSK